jgi:hypothetical protein
LVKVGFLEVMGRGRFRIKGRDKVKVWNILRVQLKSKVCSCTWKLRVFEP